MEEIKEIEAKCDSCDGTGWFGNHWYRKFIECTKCNGTGKMIIKYIPFTKKKEITQSEYYKKYCGDYLFNGIMLKNIK